MTTKRRTSSENISTPNSGRSRSPSLLSSEYIPEEDDEQVLEDESASFQPETETKKSTTSKPTTTNIDLLYQLVHELKEEDLNYHKTLIARKEAAQRATPLPVNQEDKPVNPVQTSCDTHQTSREVKHESELGAISKERDNSIKSKKENSHHKRHQECPEKPVQTGSQHPHDYETHNASAKKHHVRKGSTKKNFITENSAVEEHSTANVKETTEQERVFLHDNQVKILEVLVLLCILISKMVLLMLFTGQNHLVQHFNIFFYQNKEKNSIAHSKCP